MSDTLGDQPVFIQSFRSVGMVIPDCAIEERHSDRLIITEHPVEQGAPISDHAYKLPSEVTLRYGWSNSSFASGGAPTYILDIYDELLTMQATRQYFNITTGKRQYQNMLIADLDVETDVGTENALIVTMTCKEVIIVQTQSASLAPASAHEAPQLTSPISDTGTQQLKSVPGGNLPAELP